MSGWLSAVGSSLAWALLDFVWQGMLVGWIAALVFGLLRKARPQARYAFGCAALLLCVALPLAGVAERLIDARADAHGVTTLLLPLALADAPGAAAAAPGLGPVAFSAGRLAGWEQALQARLPLVIFFWACGAGALALRMLLGLLWVRRRSQPGRSRPDPAWQARVDRLAAQFGVRRPVRLGLVDDLPSPVTAGWWRPVILLPAALLSGMPPDLLEALLAHEMAHIKRLDYLVNLVQGAIEILLFYHPTVWWLSNRIRVEREQIADDVAASMLGEPRRLALALSGLDQFQLTTPHLAHAAHGGNLMLRIKRLVRPDTEPLNWKMALPILGLSAACAAFYAHAQSVPNIPPPPPVPAIVLAALPALPALPAQPAQPAQAAEAAQPAQLAPPAPPAPPTPPHPKAERAVPRDGRDDAYALVRATPHGTNMSGNRADWRQVETLKRSVHGDFLWFRNGGKTYVVQDAGVLARVIDAYAPLDRLGVEMDGYGQEMDQHGKAMEQLGREMGKAAGNIERGPDREAQRQINALGRQQGKLGREMERLGRQMDGASREEREKLERQMAQLGKQMDELSAQMNTQTAQLAKQGARTAQASQPMDEIGKRMEEAGKPMDALGKRMDALGKQMEQQSHAAEEVVRGLIKDAMAKGLAQPAPL
ncbi:MAG TPA: M56 family metallopeptidase [Telluria sp.]|nr:M56 family metallopeptidase [Telluria sp.]